MGLSFTSSAQARIDRANWHAFALSKLTSAKDITRVKKWVKDNLAGDSYITAIKETVGSRRHTIATFIRIKDDEDAILFKLNWAGQE